MTIYSYDEEKQSWNCEINKGMPYENGSMNVHIGRVLKYKDDIDVVFVGCTKVFVPQDQHRIVEAKLALLKCYPVWLEKETAHRYYQGYCRTILYPVFHNIIEIYGKKLGRERSETLTETWNWMPQASFSIFSASNCWADYCEVNRLFSLKVVEVFEPGNTIFVQDYHLLILPSYLFRKMPRATVGIFLNQPFPSSECFRMLTHKEEILKAMLSTDLVGFHLYEHTRSFLTCCKRMLGLRCEPQVGAVVEVHYQQRSVRVVSSHIGIRPVSIESKLPKFETLAERETHRSSLREKMGILPNKFVLLSIDELDAISGLVMKLILLERYLTQYQYSTENVMNKLYILQIAITPDSNPDKYTAEKNYIQQCIERINHKFGDIVHFQEKIDITRPERIELYTVADAFLNCCIRGQLTTLPFEYRLATSHRPGNLLISEFATPARCLPGSYIFNPLKDGEFSECLTAILTSSHAENVARSSRDLSIIHGRTLYDWFSVVLLNLLEAAKRNWAHSDTPEVFGLGLSVNFCKSRKRKKKNGLRWLDSARLTENYKNAKARLLVFDYSGTLVETSSVTSYFKSAGNARSWHYQEQGQKFTNCPGSLETRGDIPTELVDILNTLSADEKNNIVVVSSDLRDEVAHALEKIKNISIVAENGYVFKLKGSDNWESVVDEAGSGIWYSRSLSASKASNLSSDRESATDTKLANITSPDNPLLDWEWKQEVMKVMDYYTRLTNGTFYWESPSAVSYNFYLSDPEWGALSAESLYIELESKLAGLPLSVEKGKGVVTVRLAGVNRGAATAAILAKVNRNLKYQALSDGTTSKVVDFVFCAGDDIEDEVNFETINKYKKRSEQSIKVMNTRIGFTRAQQSKAKFFLDDPGDLKSSLNGLAQVTRDKNTVFTASEDISLATASFITKASMVNLNKLAQSSATLTSKESLEDVQSLMASSPRASSRRPNFQARTAWGNRDQVTEAWAQDPDADMRKVSGLSSAKKASSLKKAQFAGGKIKKNVSFKELSTENKQSPFEITRKKNQSTPNFKALEVDNESEGLVQATPVSSLRHSPSYIATPEEMNKFFGSKTKAKSVRMMGSSSFDGRAIPPTAGEKTFSKPIKKGEESSKDDKPSTSLSTSQLLLGGAFCYSLGLLSFHVFNRVLLKR